MAYIVYNSSLLDSRIQLSAEEITRPIAFGTNWVKARVGVRLIIQATQSISNYGDLWIGLCQGPYGMLTNNTVDAVAAHPGANLGASASMTWASGSVATTSNCYIARKVGASLVAGQGSNLFGNPSTYLVASPAVNTTRSAFYVDFVKSTSLMTMTLWAPTTTTAVSFDIPRYQHLANMENEGGPGYAGVSFNYNYAATSFATAATQPWDTVCVSWTRTQPVIEIDDITVVRYY